MKRLFNKSKSTLSPSSPATPTDSPGGTPIAGTPPPSGAPALDASPPPNAHQQLQYDPSQYNPSQNAPVQGGGAVPRPPRVQNVGNAIGWSCAMPTFDFPYVLSLADYLSSSSDASKEAAKALRKEFKHAQPTAQERAVRLTGILMRNTDHRFREQVASKKFLADLTDLVASKKTDPKVKDMVFRVLSPLAFDYQHDADLRPLTLTFNKLLTSPSTALSSFPSSLDSSSPSFAPNGAPLAPEDPLLAPTSLLGPASRPRRREREAPRELLEKEQMQALGARADQARQVARLLSEAVIFAGADGLEGNEIVEEFQAQALADQEFLSHNLEWASVQAEHSRSRPDRATPSSSPSAAPSSEGPQLRLASNNPFADAIEEAGAVGKGIKQGDKEEKTEEEEVLSRVLSAHSEIQDALSLLSARLSQSRLDAQHTADLAAATERSKTETRRPHPHAPGGDEWMHERNRSRDYGEGGSGAASREREKGAGDQERNQDKGKGKSKAKARESFNPYASYLAESTTAAVPEHSTGSAPSPYDGLAAWDAAAPTQPEPQQHSFAPANPYASLANSTSTTTTASAHNPLSNAAFATSSFITAEPDSLLLEDDAAPQPLVDSPSEASFLRKVPDQPSEKALGKLRRVSMLTDADPQDVEAQRQTLEDALRAKYARQYAEELEARERSANTA
ncbi:hypothetical protein JCM1841_001324 [Sporobolomyces salmonicolor]